MERDPQNTGASAEFVGRLTEAQFALRAYIAFLVGNSEDTKDVLQETNLTLWRESAFYDPARPFLVWAKSVAWYQVKTFRTRQSRERLVFDDEQVERMARIADESLDTERVLEALESCFEKLSRSQKLVVRARYFQDVGVQSIAKRLRCSVGAVSMLLFRIRDRLGACVEETLQAEVKDAH